MDQLAQAIIDALGREAISWDPADLERYIWDALRPSRGFASFDRLAPQPRLVMRPQSSEEIAAAVRLASAHGLAVVPYGGGSGLMGGAIPLRPSLVVDLTSMGRVLEVSPEDRTVKVQGGAILAHVERQLNHHGLMLGHDPWSLPIATVGGAISTNSLGYRGSKYGAMGDQVLGLTAVLPDGRILRTRAVPKASAGFDLKQLLIGTEGCFGIVTEAVLRAFPSRRSGSVAPTASLPLRTDSLPCRTCTGVATRLLVGGIQDGVLNNDLGHVVAPGAGCAGILRGSSGECQRDVASFRLFFKDRPPTRYGTSSGPRTRSTGPPSAPVISCRCTGLPSSLSAITVIARMSPSRAASISASAMASTLRTPSGSLPFRRPSSALRTLGRPLGLPDTPLRQLGLPFGFANLIATCKQIGPIPL